MKNAARSARSISSLNTNASAPSTAIAGAGQRADLMLHIWKLFNLANPAVVIETGDWLNTDHRPMAGIRFFEESL